MILVIRHAQKGPNGKLTSDGRQSARKLRDKLYQLGIQRAIVAPNDRARQTANLAGLDIVREAKELAIPDGYEEYLNKVVVGRMLEQEGEPWEKSFTRAVLEDKLYDNVFASWGEEVARIARGTTGPTEGILEGDLDYVLISSSPRIELGYLALLGSTNWQDFPRCRELEGFLFSSTELCLFK